MIPLMINFNAQCTKVEFFQEGKTMKKMTSVQQVSRSKNRWVFRRLSDATKESAALIAGGGAFQTLGEGTVRKKALKTNCFLVCPQHCI